MMPRIVHPTNPFATPALAPANTTAVYASNAVPTTTLPALANMANMLDIEYAAASKVSVFNATASATIAFKGTAVSSATASNVTLAGLPVTA